MNPNDAARLGIEQGDWVWIENDNGKNPQTGKPIKIAAATVPAFKPGKAFKEAVNVKPKKKAAKKAKK